MNAFERVQIARSTNRPSDRLYKYAVHRFLEMHGDRRYADDKR